MSEFLVNHPQEPLYQYLSIDMGVFSPSPNKGKILMATRMRMPLIIVGATLLLGDMDADVEAGGRP